MDAVELGRQIASKLHHDAVARGIDSSRPYAFALAEAKRRNLDVESSMPGSVVLHRSRAIFSASDQLIVHENEGTEFEQAFLVAHELGHASLGDDSLDDAVENVNLERSADEPPVGLDRVVGYGTRQRREVQMDLFAREFLLPREVVRRLHVEERQTANQIAERFGAPFATVAMQLLDALLLPPIVAKPEETTPVRALNAKQKTAVSHRGVPFLLTAGPGTGKTQTLVARVDALLKEGVDPRRLLLLTFSNKAAGELADRLAKAHPETASAIWVGTFHAFGLDVVRRFQVELGFTSEPRMLDRTEAVELLEEEFPRLELARYRNLVDPTDIISSMLSAISRAKDEVVDVARYAQLAQAMRDRAETNEAIEAADRALEVARVYRVYEGLKAAAGCVDFGDLVCVPVQLMERDASVKHFWQMQYDHILVDEYQDVNRSSVRLLTLLVGSGAQLWAVGDPKQSIYRFRGASSFNVSRFGIEDFPGAQTGRLECNYRSVPEIVKAFSTFSLQMPSGGTESVLKADRASAHQVPELRTIGFADEMPVVVADTIEQMRATGHRYRDQAVLCRGNEKLAELAEDLERLGVPILFLGSLFERAEVKDLMALLSVLTDRRSMGLVRVACMPQVNLSMPDVAAVLAHLRDGATPPAQWLADIDGINSLSDEGKIALSALEAILADFNCESTPWTTLAKVLLDRTSIAGDIAQSKDSRALNRGLAIWQFMNFVRVQPRGKDLPITRLTNRVRRLLRLSDERDLRQLPTAALGIDAVRLMTMHGAKGLEFPVVHIPNLTAASMPGTPRPQPCPPALGMIEGTTGTADEMRRTDHAQELECLFFVAITRARDRLFMYSPTLKRNRTVYALSPFLSRLGSDLVTALTSPSQPLPPRPEAADVDVRFEGNLRFDVTQIALYERCPRRFFYSHVLQTGGRRTSTAFMQMHDAVRTVLRSIVTADTPGDQADVERQIDAALDSQGLAGHGYINDYRSIALALIEYFQRSRDGRQPQPIEAISVTIGQEQIIVRPDDILEGPGRQTTVRRVQTGHKRSKDGEDVAAAAFVLAARQAFPDALVEFVHLADAATMPVVMSAKVINNRKGTVHENLGSIRAGRFPANGSDITCPNCPALFICGPTPAGQLTKGF